MRPPPSITRLLLAIIVVTAAVVRVWGIGFGLPHRETRPDESVANQIAINILSGDPNPHFFQWPTLFMYVLAGAFAAWHFVAVALGRHTNASDLAIEWVRNPAVLFLIGRALSAAAGTLTVVLVYRIGRRLSGDATGLAASACLALAFLNVRDSHFGMLDVPMTLFVTAAMLCVIEDRLVTAALFGGFAAATKYNAVIVAVPIVVSEILRAADRRWTRQDIRQSLARVAGYALVFTAAFFALTPFALLDWPKFSFDVLDQLRHMAAPHAGIYAGRGWTRHLLINLRYGMGLPLLVAGLCGMVALWFVDWRRALALSSFPIVYYAVAGNSYTVFARYMNPIVPMLCVTAGWFAVWTGSQIARSTRRLSGAAATTFIVIALVVPSAMSVIAFDRLIGRPDTRALAANWLRDRIQPTDSVYRNGYADGQPALYMPHRDWSYDVVRSQWLAPDVVRADGPTWIVVQESGLRSYSALPAQLRPLLERRYELQQTFHAANARDRRHVYDQQDAFYVPLAGFAGVQWPGPNLYIYRRKE